jgi:hypothetical protein
LWRADARREAILGRSPNLLVLLFYRNRNMKAGEIRNRFL